MAVLWRAPLGTEGSALCQTDETAIVPLPKMPRPVPVYARLPKRDLVASNRPRHHTHSTGIESHLLTKAHWTP